MKTTWIIAADASRARIFELPDDTREMHELQDFAHPEGRAAGRDLVAEPSGRFYGKGERVQGHSANELSDPIHHENELFARALAAILEEGRTDNRYDALVLIAPPKFLGTLRNVLPKHADKLVVRTVPKDVVKLGPDEIRRYATELA